MLCFFELKKLFVFIFDDCVRSAGGSGCHGSPGHLRRKRPVGEVPGDSIQTGMSCLMSLRVHIILSPLLFFGLLSKQLLLKSGF